MEKEFVTYELALKLKELGFDEECLAFYIKIGEKMCINMYTNNNRVFTNKILYVPLWQQAFDWFREKHNLGYSIHPITLESFVTNINNADLILLDGSSSYNGAELKCLEKLIEIIENDQQRN